MTDHFVSQTVRAIDALYDNYTQALNGPCPSVLEKVGLSPERVRELLGGTNGCSPPNIKHRTIRMEQKDNWVEIIPNARELGYDARYASGQIRFPTATAKAIGLVRGCRAKIYHSGTRIKVQVVETGGMSVIADAGHLRVQSKSLATAFGAKTIITFKHVGDGVLEPILREVRK